MSGEQPHLREDGALLELVHLLGGVPASGKGADALDRGTCRVARGACRLGRAGPEDVVFQERCHYGEMCGWTVSECVRVFSVNDEKKMKLQTMISLLDSLTVDLNL